MSRWPAADLQKAQKRLPAGPTDRVERSQARSTEGQATLIPPKSPRASKYGNRPTGHYSSRKEANRALELQLLQAAGKIRNLREQVKYVIFPKQDGERECYYLADFVYEEQDKDDFDRWKTVAEDCKGFKTPSYVIKRKGMLWRYGIRIRET